MIIYIALKHAGNLTKKVKEVPICLYIIPKTLREFIEEMVRICVKDFNERVRDEREVRLPDDEEWICMKTVGKFFFGDYYNHREANTDEAVNTAIEAVEDGLVRIFNGKKEITGIDSNMEIHDGDSFTFIKLTMLSGRMW